MLKTGKVVVVKLLLTDICIWSVYSILLTEWPTVIILQSVFHLYEINRYYDCILYSGRFYNCRIDCLV